MKKSDEQFDLEQLLKTVEHAGRDSSRQQQLSEMIDNMAAADNKKHHIAWRRWSVAVSAAACVALFVTTIVRLTGTPTTIATQQAGPLSAGLVNDTLSKTSLSVDTAKEVRNIPIVHNVNPSTIALVNSESDEPAQEIELNETNPVVDTLIMDVEPEILLAENIEVDSESEKQDAVSVISNPIVSIGNNEKVSPQSQPESKKKNRGLFRLRRAEPSLMDGTMLAFSLL